MVKKWSGDRVGSSTWPPPKSVCATIATPHVTTSAQKESSSGAGAPLPFGHGEFDRVFTSHFFHHLSPDRRAAFIADARRVGRELVVVEDVRRADAPAEEWHERVLSDGSRHRMHRHSFTAAELITELGAGQVLHEGRWFVVVAAN